MGIGNLVSIMINGKDETYDVVLYPDQNCSKILSTLPCYEVYGAFNPVQNLEGIPEPGRVGMPPVHAPSLTTKQSQIVFLYMPCLMPTRET